MVHRTFLLCIRLEFYFIEQMYDCQGRICKPFISATLLYTYISRFSVDLHYRQRRIYMFVPFTNLRQFSNNFAFSVTSFLCEPCRKKYPAEQRLNRSRYLCLITAHISTERNSLGRHLLSLRFVMIQVRWSTTFYNSKN